MIHRKEWSPKKFTSSQIEETLIDSLEQSVENQRVLTKYTGSDDGFYSHVANTHWDPYTYKLIGENTGSILTVIFMADDLGIFLPAPLLRQAALYAYTA